MPEVRIKTDFGEIVIPYNTLDELQKGLTEIDKVVEIVTSKVGTLTSKEKPEIKSGFEDIYRTNKDGSVSLLKPGSSIENIGLVLFAYDPTPLKVELIARYSGVKQAKSYLGNKAYQKYFDKREHGSYKLNSNGLSWVINEVIPKLRGTKQE